MIILDFEDLSSIFKIVVSLWVFGIEQSCWKPRSWVSTTWLFNTQKSSRISVTPKLQRKISKDVVVLQVLQANCSTETVRLLSFYCCRNHLLWALSFCGAVWVQESEELVFHDLGFQGFYSIPKTHKDTAILNIDVNSSKSRFMLLSTLDNGYPVIRPFLC